MKESEERFRQAMEAANEGLWEWEIATGKSFFSPAGYHLLGYEPGECTLGMHNWLDFIHPEDREKARARHQTCVDNPGAVFEAEFRMRAKDGTWKWVLGRGQAFARDNQGRAWRVIGTYVDITERKRTEQLLKKETTFRQILFESSPDGMVIIDPLTARFVEFNTAAHRQLRYSREEFARLSIIDIEAVETAWGVKNRIAAVLQSGHADFETVQRARDGELRHIHVTAQVLEILGQPTYYCIWRDITERKQLQAALEKRLDALTAPLAAETGLAFEELFRLPDIQRIQDEFAAATGVASIITRPDGSPITQPSGFTRFCREIVRKTRLGCANCYKSDAILGSPNPRGPVVQPCLSGGLWDAGASITVGGRHIANWLIGQVRDETQTEAHMQEYAREIGADEGELVQAFREVPAMSREQFKRVAQVLFTLASQLSASAYQNVQQARFIAERQRAETALRENETRQRAMIANISDVIAIATPEFLYSFLSPNIARWFGWKPEELIGRPVLEHLHPEDQAAAVSAFDTLAHQSGAVVNLECRYRCPDETYKWIELGAVNLISDSTIRGLLLNYHDISERKRQAMEREKLQAELTQAQKMESIGRLAGGVAHDFNNMLQAILVNASLALEELPLDSPLRESFEEIQACALRSADLTRQLLAFARKQAVAPQILDLNAKVSGMLKMLQRLIGENIELKWLPGIDIRPVKIDPSQIDQLLANLCVNARDAIADNGELTIQTENLYLNASLQAVHPEMEPGDYVLLTVSDNGCGMGQEALKHMFEPFFTTKGLGKGTGLGLATVYGIIKQNGGFIDVDSAPGKGTTFKIYLPQCEESAEPSPNSRSIASGHASSTPTGRGTILIVEDEPALLRAAKRTLEEHGYQVLAAEQPKLALQLASDYPGEIHLLVTDVIMPGMNGRDFALRLAAQRPRLKRLFMSGYTADVISPQGILEDGLCFIQKPFAVSELLRVVRALLSPGAQE